MNMKLHAEWVDVYSFPVYIFQQTSMLVLLQGGTIAHYSNSHWIPQALITFRDVCVCVCVQVTHKHANIHCESVHWARVSYTHMIMRTASLSLHVAIYSADSGK